jgi:hypothetical protein
MARFKVGDKVRRVTLGFDHEIVYTVICVGPWGAAKQSTESWYGLRDEPEDAGHIKKAFDAWEKDLVSA